MADLIDRAALLEAMKRVYRDSTCPMHIAAEIDQYITEAPVVDAVRVQHRQWERRRAFSSDVVCSGCGTLQTTKDSQYKSRFCPGCGAKMDGERKENG